MTYEKFFLGSLTVSHLLCVFGQIRYYIISLAPVFPFFFFGKYKEVKTLCKSKFNCIGILQFSP